LPYSYRFSDHGTLGTLYTLNTRGDNMTGKTL
jgi:hypothetical protein